MKKILIGLSSILFAVQASADMLVLINHYPTSIVLKNQTISPDGLANEITISPGSKFQIKIDPKNLVNKEIYLSAAPQDQASTEDFLGIGPLAVYGASEHLPTPLMVRGYLVTPNLSFSWSSPGTTVSVTFCDPKDFNTNTYQCM